MNSGIGFCLAKHASRVEACGKAAWSLLVSNGGPLAVSARLDEDWLLLDAPLKVEWDTELPWRLLCWNRHLPGTAKFALGAAPRAVHLRAEIALSEDIDEGARIAESLAGFRCALDWLHGSSAVEPGRSRSTICPEETPQQGAPELAELLTEAGWRFTERAGGALHAELETRGGFHQAAVEAQACSAVRVSVELAHSETLAEASRQALASLLLTAGGAVRFVRGAAESTAGRTAVFLETKFSTPPCATELDRALAALSVASRLCGREATVVENERIARSYLAIRCVAGA